MNDIDKDNHIADFVDGKTASSPDPELVQLEETILRLKSTLPSDAPDIAKSKQMLVRLKARMKREEETKKIPFWKKLFNFQANPQVGMILAVAMILIIAIISVPSLEIGGSSNPVTGTANNSTSLLIGGGLIVMLLLVYWIFRKR